MAPPTPLERATNSVLRLVKEESYYHKELAHQESRISKLQTEIDAGKPDLDSNAPYMLKQEQTALEETKAVFGPLRDKIAEAVQSLEEQIAITESDGAEGKEEELKKAREAVESGKKVAEQQQ
ncbi:tubulin binding cofactor A [Triangularia verruculosa]|uniref:Tubulin-specific chaperone A n=1 Tax=Triangularia verruculosa TaxID=2587418 RepID=A0AAN6XFC4_9PEZI|nr:tubulin binding cofactor A [Triangularia verruculosa]